MAINIRDISVYALRKPPVSTAYRDVSAYALIKEQPVPVASRLEVFALSSTPPEILATRVAAWALIPDVKAAQFDVAGIVHMRDVILRELAVDVDGVKIAFVKAEALTGDLVYNAKVTVKALPGSRLIGSYSIRYNRYDLSAALTGKGLENLSMGSATSAHQLISAINDAANITLSTIDVEDTPIQAGSSSVELVAAANSYYFKTGTKFRVGVDNSLENAIKISDMNGFNG